MNNLPTVIFRGERLDGGNTVFLATFPEYGVSLVCFRSVGHARRFLSAIVQSALTEVEAIWRIEQLPFAEWVETVRRLYRGDIIQSVVFILPGIRGGVPPTMVGECISAQFFEERDEDGTDDSLLKFLRDVKSGKVGE